MGNTNSTADNNSSSSLAFFSWTGLNLLLVLIYGVIIAIMGFILLQRIVHRVQMGRSFVHQQSNPGSDGPKKFRAEINKELDDVVQFHYEPKLMSTFHDDFTFPPDCDYEYRMRAVDGFSALDKCFGEVNQELVRPMGRDVGQHLLDVKSHSSGCLRSLRTNHLQNVTDLYRHARYGAEPFTSHEYEKYVDLVGDVVSVLRQRAQHHKKNKEKKKDASKHTLGRKDVEASQHRNDASDRTVYQTTSLTVPEIRVEMYPSTSSLDVQQGPSVENEPLIADNTSDNEVG